MLTLLADSTVRWALAANALLMRAAFMVIPNIAAHLQQNLGYPRYRLEWAYAVGGVCSFVVMRFAGQAVDRRGAPVVAAAGTLVLGAALLFGFIAPDHFFHLPVFVLFAIFMSAMATRNVALQSLSTRVPAQHERAGYMSLQSTAQHLFSAVGAVLATAMLHATPDGRLAGIDHISIVALALAVTLPPLLVLIGQRVSAREIARAAAMTATAA
jgi:predicted MFS family arabinose efflux permease